MPSRFGVFCVVIVAALTRSVAVDAADAGTPELVQRGEYVARAGDCIACHTEPGGQPFAGGRALNTSFGAVYSSNITPDVETGIGQYTADDFVKLMREGIARGGHRVYPAMPYTSFARVTRDDLLALHAYLMHGVEPVRKANLAPELTWPMSMRWLMGLWNVFFFEKGEYVADPQRPASWNRGAYLVQGLGHCGACHTPRGFAGQEKARSERDGKNFLGGALLDNWYAAPLTGDPIDGLHAWSQDEIVEFLKTGRTERVAAMGIMSEVIEKSTQYLTQEDLLAIAEYLKSLPPLDQHAQAARQAEGAKATPATIETTTVALRAGNADARGARVYLDNCNACHQSNGAGAARTFPALARNEVVNSHDPTTLIRLVLMGSAMPATQTAPSALAMPDFGWRLSDDDIADVLSLVRSSWGNQAAAVSRSEVAQVRAALDESESASTTAPGKPN